MIPVMMNLQAKRRPRRLSGVGSATFLGQSASRLRLPCGVMISNLEESATGFGASLKLIMGLLPVDSPLDELLAEWCDDQYFEGVNADKVDKLSAALADHYPDTSRHEKIRLPRFARARRT